MKGVNRDKILLFLYAGLSVIIMAGIFMFSCQPGESSQNLSNFVLDGMKDSGADIFTPEITAGGGDEEGFSFNLVGRKWGHFYLYAALGVSVFLWWRKLLAAKGKASLLNAKSAGLAFVFCFIYGCTDEFHQRFVDGRTGQLSDVMYDAAGFGVSILLAFCLAKVIGIIRGRIHK